MKRSKADVMRANSKRSPWRHNHFVINPEGKPPYRDEEIQYTPTQKVQGVRMAHYNCKWGRSDVDCKRLGAMKEMIKHE